jgi:hypothetical protein
MSGNLDNYEVVTTKSGFPFLRRKQLFPSVNLRFPGDPEGLRLVQHGGDLAARLLLLDLVKSEFESRNFDGAAALLHAMFYLEDRTAYELCRPPNRRSIPGSFLAGESYTRHAEAVLGIRSRCR